MQFGIKVFRIGIFRIYLFRVLPVQIIEFYLHEVPMVLSLVVPSERPIEYRDVAMVGKTEITDASGSLLLHQIVQYTIIDKATIELLHTTPGAYGVKKKVVHIVRLQLLKRILEHLYGSLATPSLGSEVGKLRGYEVTASVITLQGIARSLFGKPFTISRRRVEIIYPMLQRIVYLTVDHLLVYRSVGRLPCLRKSHHTVA